MRESNSLLGTSVPWPRLSALLDQALTLPPSGRQHWLANLDESHAQCLESLRTLLDLQARIEADDFLGAGPRLPLPSSGDEPAPGRYVGGYRLVREIGRGGMSTVWEAEHKAGLFQPRVAVKLPKPSRDGVYAARLADESRILAMLQHPNIPRLQDSGVDTMGCQFMAMSAIQGQHLDAHCRSRASSLHERISLILQVTRAVAFANDRNVLHGDLKPTNIMVDDRGHAWLLDFGASKLLAHQALAEKGLEQADRAMTFEYASPEQLLGDPQTVASDVYSLGVVAYELLTGVRPCRPDAKGQPSAAQDVAAMTPRPASVVSNAPSGKRVLTGRLDMILRKALMQAPSDRYPTMHAFAADLQHFVA